MAHLRETVEERLKRMKRLARIDEASYSLIGGIEEDDEMPDLSEPKPISAGDAIYGEQEDDTSMNPEQEVNQDSITGQDVPVEPDDNKNDIPVDAEMGGEEEAIPDMGMDSPQPEEPSVEEKQNEIIKLNISAMQKMQRVIDDLENTVTSLNGKIGSLSADVEEVREPTNVEKLMQRKEDSHPFYYNLNDMWDGNSFQARKQEEGIRGITQLDDGTYIADFDDLPKHNSQEITSSFNSRLR